MHRQGVKINNLKCLIIAEIHSQDQTIREDVKVVNNPELKLKFGGKIVFKKNGHILILRRNWLRLMKRSKTSSSFLDHS